MSIVEDVRPIGVRPAERRPVRALALLSVSRATVGLLIVAIAWAASVVRSASPDYGAEVRPLVLVERSPVARSGTSVAAMLDDVRTRVDRQGGTLVELDLDRRSGGDAALRLVVDLPGTGSTAVDRLAASLSESELDEAAPRSVDPVPSGLRVSIDAALTLGAARPGADAPEGRAAAVALAEAAERAGVELRGVVIPAREQDPVRLVATGASSAVVALVELIEQEHSSPQRFRSMSVRRTPAGQYEAVLTFGLRQDVARLESEVGE